MVAEAHALLTLGCSLGLLRHHATRSAAADAPDPARLEPARV